MASTAAPPDGRSWATLRPTAVLAAALMAGNLANYLLAIAGSHQLSPSDYGLFGSLLAVLLVGSIPALALQAVVARRTAATDLTLPAALRTGLSTGAASVVVGLLALPALSVFLRVPHYGLAVLWAVLGLLPLNLLAAVQGHLQGRERFGRLSQVVVAVGAARVLGGLAPLLLGGGPQLVMAGVSLAAAAVAIPALWLSRSRPHPSQPAPRVRPELVTASLSMGALLLLSNLDLLLARHLLPSADAGHYAAGNVVAKVAFWLPQAVPLTALPGLSRVSDRRRALREAAALTAAVAAACIVVTAVAGSALTRVTFGSGYAGIGRLAWLFAVQGSALAGAQLLVVDDIANRRRGVAPMAVAAAVVEAAVVLGLHGHHARPIIGVAAAVAVLLTAAATVRVLAAARREPARGQCAASAQLRPTPTDTSSGTSKV